MSSDREVSPYKTTIDAGNAYWMARLANAVYKSRDDNSPDDDAILAELQEEDPKFKDVKGVSKNSAQAALVEHENYLCMTFRGTDSTMKNAEKLKDWLDNFKAFSKKTSYGEFHTGFCDSFEDVWGQLQDDYKSLHQKEPRPLFFTGHSLGGAMASIAAAKRVGKDEPFTSAYTFGQPRAMTRETAQMLNWECGKRVFRFQNNNDIVSRLPARLMGYSHVGTFVYIKKDGELDHEPGLWLQFLDSMEGILERVQKDEVDEGFFSDHSMDNYLRAVEAWNTEDDFLKKGC